MGLQIRFLGDRSLEDHAWRLAAKLNWPDVLQAEYIALTQLQADALVLWTTNSPPRHVHSSRPRPLPTSCGRRALLTPRPRSEAKRHQCPIAPRSEFGPWKTVWKRHRRYAGNGTWDRVLMALLAMADADGKLDWTVSVDATINRAHQHATNTTRPDQDTGGWVELQESAAD